MVTILVATVLRLSDIGSAATLNLHIIRQMIGLSVARNFAREGVDFLRPLLDVAWWPADPPWSMGLEFPLVPAIHAALFRIFGEHFWLANATSVIISAIAAALFLALARDLLADDAGALGSLIVFVFLPEAYKYSRTIQPDSLALLLSIAFLLACRRWMVAEREEERSRRSAVWRLSVLCCGVLLALVKLNYLFVLLPGVFMIAGTRGWRRLLRFDTALGATAIVGTAAAYLVASSNASDFPQAGLLLSGSALPGLLANWSDPAFWGSVESGLGAWFTLPGAAIAAIGISLLAKGGSRENRYLLLGWSLSLAAYLWLMGPDLLGPHMYYFLPLLPLASIGVGGCVVELRRRIAVAGRLSARMVAAATVLVAVVAAGGAWWALRGYFTTTGLEMADHEAVGRLVSENTDSDDLLLYVSEDWGITLYVAYVAERRGWHVPPSAELFEEMLEEAGARGARYVVVQKPLHADRYLTDEGEYEAYVTVSAIARSDLEVAKESPEAVLYSLDR